MAMFDHHYLTYNIAQCRMVIAPTLVEADWSLYVWNFDRKTIVILDPVTMVSGSQAVMLKHNDIVDKMHEAMTTCKEVYFPYPNVPMQDWQREFISIDGAHCDSSKSGLYTMFYARYFDGKTLTRILTAVSHN
ncbi:unnamed protein product [Urochloa decumbens]|uniref:Fungal-type protein kinase domain-containing protein n=1 Tax=Urochloa decumbens TaxID=240449 RepID=A0ABC8X7D9_9POAL